MLKMIISGCNGHMGRSLASVAGADSEIDVVAGFDVNAVRLGSFPVYADPMEFNGTCDVIVDFSSPVALDGLLSYCIHKKMPLVLCTTGYSPEQLTLIDGAAEKIPVFRSGNMSLGINLLADLIKRACAVLGEGFDIEIIEKHHRRKVDAPSGTALMLANAAADALPYTPEYVYDRQPKREARGKTEIGISAVRGGTIVGEHEIIFAGLDEVIEIKHSAFSREVFVTGAISAAKFMTGMTKSGLYNMSDVLK